MGVPVVLYVFNHELDNLKNKNLKVTWRVLDF